MGDSLKRCLFFILIAILFPIVGCALGTPLEQDYYAGTGKIAGGNPPSVPVVTFVQSQLRFDFTASIDPESGGEVGSYFIYAYTGIPQIFYQARDIDSVITMPATRGFNYTGPQTGTRTIIVTGFDGYRESAVTNQNTVTFSFP